MAKLHWTPWMALTEMGNDAGRMAEHGTPGKDCGYAWQPVADVVETADNFRVTLELAGVAREDVSVELHGQRLVIQGERRFEKDAGGGLFQMLERCYGPFSRSFTLQKGLSRAGITAVMKDGLLVVVVPKVRPERLHRRIPIG